MDTDGWTGLLEDSETLLEVAPALDREAYSLLDVFVAVTTLGGYGGLLPPKANAALVLSDRRLIIYRPDRRSYFAIPRGRAGLRLSGTTSGASMYVRIADERGDIDLRVESGADALTVLRIAGAVGVKGWRQNRAMRKGLKVQARVARRDQKWKDRGRLFSQTQVARDARWKPSE